MSRRTSVTSGLWHCRVKTRREEKVHLTGETNNKMADNASSLMCTWYLNVINTYHLLLPLLLHLNFFLSLSLSRLFPNLIDQRNTHTKKKRFYPLATLVEFSLVVLVQYSTRQLE